MLNGLQSGPTRGCGLTVTDGFAGNESVFLPARKASLEG